MAEARELRALRNPALEPFDEPQPMDPAVPVQLLVDVESEKLQSKVCFEVTVLRLA